MQWKSSSLCNKKNQNFKHLPKFLIKFTPMWGGECVIWSKNIGPLWKNVGFSSAHPGQKYCRRRHRNPTGLYLFAVNTCYLATCWCYQLITIYWLCGWNWTIITDALNVTSLLISYYFSVSQCLFEMDIKLKRSSYNCINIF